MSRSESRRTLRRTAVLVLSLLAELAPTIGHAQVRSRLDQGGAILSGAEEIAYLRTRALSDTAFVPVNLQPLSAATADQLRRWAAEVGPWRERFVVPMGSGVPSRRSVNLVEWTVLRPDVAITYHSALPLSRNDGVVWAGRGMTASAQAGIGVRWRGVEVQLAPLAFVAQNAPFALAPNGGIGSAAYADPRYPGNIDHVQAFGSGAYSRLDAGDSFIRIEGLGATAGLSNARITWGPAREYPLVMSTNAGGFPHFFVGTLEPAYVWIGTIHARWIGGRVEQSDFSPVQSGRLHRFTSGFVASYSPRGLRGFELGGTRVMQVRWPAGGPTPSQMLRPFSGVVSDPDKGALNNVNGENGFASLFVRLAPPGSGIEAYAELSREDFTGSLRALIAKPDDLAQFTLGVARSRSAADGSMTVVRAELVNGELSAAERGQRKLNAPIPSYTHAGTNQGLTSRGQILGSPIAYGGGGSSITWERYHGRGRTSIQLERQLRLDWLPALGTSGTRTAETLYGIRFEQTRFTGGREWMLTIAPSRILNRNLVVGHDLWNLEVAARRRGW